MNRRQNNHLASARAVRDTLGKSKHAAVLAAVAAIATEKATLTSQIGVAEGIAQKQAHPTGGMTQQKRDALTALTNATLAVAGGIRRWARSVNNNDALQQASVTASDLLYGRGDHAQILAGAVLKLGNDNAAALVAFNVDAGKLSALDSALTAFKGLIAAPRDVVVDDKAATGELAVALKNIDDTLTNLDDLAETAHADFPDFYREYKIARNIIDLPGGQGGGKTPATPTPPPPA